jgi:hypothetical protein
MQKQRKPLGATGYNWLILSFFNLKKPLNPSYNQRVLEGKLPELSGETSMKKRMLIAGQTKILISKFPLRIFCEKRYGWKSSYHYGF